MPYKLRWHDQDPLAPNKTRGPGYYYGRGRGYFSKYNLSRDKKVISTGFEQNPIGLPRDSAWLHLRDGVLSTRKKRKK